MATVLVSGANKGKDAQALRIGYGFVQKYLARPNTTVIGTVRDPSAASFKALYDIPKALGSSIILVKVESTSETDAIEAVKSLSTFGIDHLDLVLRNAGVVKLAAFVPVADLKIPDLMEHADVNAA
ncbi:hypothetical protein LTR39_003150, partial [Cryomyces antarcticus]